MLKEEDFAELEKMMRERGKAGSCLCFERITFGMSKIATSGCYECGLESLNVGGLWIHSRIITSLSVSFPREFWGPNDPSCQAHFWDRNPLGFKVEIGSACLVYLRLLG